MMNAWQLVRRTLLTSAPAVLMVACSSSATPDVPASGDPAAGVTAEQAPPAAPPDEAPTAMSPSSPSPNPAWGKDKCPPLPAGIQSGVGVGQQLAQLTVKDCDGNDYPLANVCGAPATWIAVAHGWCPHCQAAARSSESILAEYAGKSVAALSILVESSQSKPPTAADCKAWKKAYGLSNVIALYDPKGVTLALNDDGYTALNVFVDEDRVIRSKFHGESPTTIKAGIDAALGPR